jgi:DNA polymerase-3 subunit gamma/tau
MLTNEAFNALLKTLEEPPKNVFFVLATTEVHKIPETILSRCQRFDFRRINKIDIINRLEFIVKAEKIKVEAEALEMIAIYSNGGLRDAISILDQLAVSDKVTAEDTKRLLGSTGIDTIYTFLECLLSANDQKAFEIVSAVNEQGSDLNQFRLDVLKIAREKLHLAIEKNDLNQKSALIHLIETWQEIHNTFKTNLIPELPLEVLIVRSCNNLVRPVAAVIEPVVVPVVEQPVSKVVSEPVAKAIVEPAIEAEPIVQAVEKGLKKIPSEPKVEEVVEPVSEAVVEPVIEEEPVVAEVKTPLSSDVSKDWKKIVENISVTTLKRMLKNTEYKQVSSSEAEISIYSDFEFNTIKKSENIHSIESLLEKHSGQKIHVSLKKEEPKVKVPDLSQPLPDAAIPKGVPVQFNDGPTDFEPFDMFEGDVVE